MSALSPKLSEGVFRFAFLFLLVLLPLYFGAVYLWYYSILVFLLCLFLGGYFLSIPRPEGLFPIRRTSVDLWIGAYGVFFLLSALFSKIPSLTFLEAYKTASLVCFFVAAVYFGSEKKNVRSFGTTLAFVGGLLSLAGLLQLSGGLPNPWWHKPYFLSASFVNHNHFAGFIEIVLPVSLGFTMAETDKAKRILLIFLCGLMMVAFLFSLSRGGILSLGLAAVVMTSLLVKRGILKQAWWIWATLLIFAGAMMLLFGVEPLVERLQSLRMIVEVDESVSRLRIWQAAIGLISQNFWLGTGPGTFGDAVLFFKAEPFHGRPVHAHNDYLELMADGGIFVFLAFLVLFFAVMRKGWRLFHETEKRSKLGLAAGVLTSGMALAIHSTVDFNFHVPANAVYFTAVAALMLSRSEGGHYTGAIQRKAVVSVFSLLFIVTLAGSVFFGLSDFFKWRGQKALERKDYSQAVRAMTRSLVFNPSSAETFYLRGLAHERAWLKDTRGENDSLIQSISDFRKASRLNPLEPYYEYHKTKMSCRSGAIRSDREVIAAYEKVIQKEPKDPDLYFLSGRDLLKLAGKTRETLEQKAVSLLKECMNMDRLYRDRIYGLLWDYKRNLRFLESFSLETGQGLRGLLKFIEKWELWSYHRKLFLKSVGVDAYVHDKEAAALYADSRPGRFFSMEDFDKVPGDEAAMGKNFYRKGNISKSVSLNGKRSLLILRAKSRKVAGIYGYLLVRLDHKPVQSFYVRSPDYEEYPAILSHEPGTHTLTLSYLNDKVDPERGGDRNIWIERIEIRDA